MRIFLGPQVGIALGNIADASKAAADGLNNGGGRKKNSPPPVPKEAKAKKMGEIKIPKITPENAWQVFEDLNKQFGVEPNIRDLEGFITSNKFGVRFQDISGTVDRRNREHYLNEGQGTTIEAAAFEFLQNLKEVGRISFRATSKSAVGPASFKLKFQK